MWSITKPLQGPLAAPVAGHGCCCLNATLALWLRLIRASTGVQTSNWFPESAPGLTHYTPTPQNRRSLPRQALRSDPLSQTHTHAFPVVDPRGVYKFQRRCFEVKYSLPVALSRLLNATQN